MKKVLFLTSLFAFALSITAFAQSQMLPQKKMKAEREVMTQKEKGFDCETLDLKVEKKENQYEVVLNTIGERPHHWDLIPLSRSESNARARTQDDYTILTTKRNKINLSKNGKYLLNVMSAEDDILCSTPIHLTESNARGAQAFIRSGLRWYRHPRF